MINLIKKDNLNNTTSSLKQLDLRKIYYDMDIN